MEPVLGQGLERAAEDVGEVKQSGMVDHEGAIHRPLISMLSYEKSTTTERPENYLVTAIYMVGVRGFEP